MACVVIAVCLTVYYLTRSSEKQDFEDDFVDLGGSVATSFESVVEQRFGILESFVAEITANSNQSMPFVTPIGYAYQADTVSRLAHVLFLKLIPRVERAQVGAWSAYMAANKGWKAEGIVIAAGIDPEDVNASPISPTILDIHSGGPPRPDKGP
jgi:hypothetical protein